MRLAVIGAMEEEVTILRNKLENAKTETIAHCEFTTGEYEGTEVILLKSGIGKVNALSARRFCLTVTSLIMSLTQAQPADFIIH